MHRIYAFFCVLLLTAMLLLQRAADTQDWPVNISYQYPAVTLAADPAVRESNSDTEPKEPGAGAVLFPLDLNLATREELMQVPRIGEVLSGRIVQYRDVIGGYTDLTQLTDIKGISENILREIGAYLSIG